MPMYGFNDLKDKVKKYFWFDQKEEIKAIVISILMMAFIVGFDDGREVFNLLYWLGNFLIVTIIVAIAFLVHVFVQKVQGLHYGFKVEYKLWWYGLLIGLGVAFFTRGVVWLLIPGGIFLHLMPVHRLGWFRYRTNMLINGVTAFVGPLANCGLALIARVLLIFMPGNVLLYKVIYVNLWMAVFTMLPIPPLNGSRVFFYSRLVYSFIAGCIIGLAFLLRFTNINVFIVILLSFIIGVIIWLSYFFLVER